MPRAATACTICRHTRREAIETAAAVEGADVLAVAQTFGVSRRTLDRHLTEHVTQGTPLAAVAQEPEGQSALSSPAALEAVDSPPATRSARVSSERADLGPVSPALADGTVVDRARALLGYLAVPGRTTQELAQAREIRAALTLEARLVGAMTTKAKLHEHPDWDAHVEAIVTALARIPGALDALDASFARAEARRTAA